MSDILLVCANQDTTATEKLLQVENLGLLYVSTSLEASGFSCDIIDNSEELLKVDGLMAMILDNLPTLYLGFAIWLNNIRNTAHVISQIRSKNAKCHITTGGIWASLKYRSILKNLKGVDSVVVGEGEKTAVDLALALKSGNDWTAIPGVASRSPSAKIKLSPRKLLEDLDSLPTINRKHYMDRIFQTGICAVSSTRGCHGRCTFCNIDYLIRSCGGKRRRTRDPLRMVDEIEDIVKLTKISWFVFVDDDFIGISPEDHRRCRTFASEIEKRGLNIKFNIITQAKAIDMDLMRTLRDVGLSHVGIGIESWVDSQLFRYGKCSSRKDNLQAMDILERCEISSSIALIPLDPYVTKQEILLNVLETERIGLDKILRISFRKKLEITEFCELFHQCQNDHLLRKYDPYSLDTFSIPYDQKNDETDQIVRASERMEKLYYDSLRLLKTTGQIKQLTAAWENFIENLKLKWRPKLFSYYKEFILNSDSQDDGESYVSHKMRTVCVKVSQICDEVTREKMEQWHNFSIDVDGVEVSTRMNDI